jgi:hypothetical protein
VGKVHVEEGAIDALYYRLWGYSAYKFYVLTIYFSLNLQNRYQFGQYEIVAIYFEPSEEPSGQTCHG